MASQKLTPKQEMFCRHYVANGLNATQAAISAGYSKKNADKIGPRLVGESRAVQDRIAELTKPILDKLEVDAERVIRGFVNDAFYDPRDVIDWGPTGVIPKPARDLTLEQAQLMADPMKLKLADRQAAREWLAKYLGMLKSDDPTKQAAAGSAEGVMKAVLELSDEELQKLALLRPTHAN